MESRAAGVLVGRARELAELTRALDAARAGRGHTVLVSGEAGIGKTRLAAETGRCARAGGFEVLLGRSIDLVGTELPYQPFADALRPLGTVPFAAGTAGSQVRVFEETLALLGERASRTPLLIVLEDLHWADTSTLDLVVFLAHHLGDRRVLLLTTGRPDEPASAGRMERLTDGIGRAEAALVLGLGPLADDDLAALLAAHPGGGVSPAVAAAVIARCEGNPFFAEELLAAAGEPAGRLPPGLRDLLLRRVARLDAPTRGLLRLAAAAGRDVRYPLLRAAAPAPERDLRESLRQATEHGVLVADQATSSFRFRHALLAEAVYATILPGEREELHARLATELARGGTAGPAELAGHWAAAGRPREALAASVDAARQAAAVFGLAEAHAHLERALACWPAVPEADRLAKIDLAGLCAWAAELASQVRAAPRAVELARRAIELAGAGDAHRAALLHVRLGEYLYAVGRDEAGLAALARAVELVPADPPSAQRAYALGSLAGGLMVAWRHAESLPIGEEALALARLVGAGEAEVRARTVRGSDLAYLGRGADGLAELHRAVDLAGDIGDRWGLERAYVNLTDVLTMLGRPGESARIGLAGIEVLGRYGIDSTVLVANTVEARIATGAWAEADSLSAAALRATTGDFPYVLRMLRADLEVGRGDFAAARDHLAAAVGTLREDHGQGVYDISVAELALWEHRWLDALAAVRAALTMASSVHSAQLRVWFGAKGLRAEAELAALARARRDTGAVRARLGRARELVDTTRREAADAAAATPNAGAWLATAEAEYERARGTPRPEAWSAAATGWDRLERAPLAAYCRWRHAEALVAAGSSRTEATVPLRAAYAVAARLGARPLVRELDLLAQRARLDPTASETGPSGAGHGLREVLGLTEREAEVLTLVARGCTNREIAATLVISVKTADIHVTHILRKLGVPNRVEAAAVAHRLTGPPPA